MSSLRDLCRRWYRKRGGRGLVLLAWHAAATLRYRLFGGAIDFHDVTIEASEALDLGQLGSVVAGTYEREEIALLKRHLPPDVPIVEFGGGIGAVACVIDDVLDDGVAHVVVEPNPELCDVIERNRDLNDASFDLVRAGYDPDGEPVWFRPGDQHHTGTVTSTGPDGIQLPGISLETLLDRHEMTEAVLVADIEGAERALIHQELPSVATRLTGALIEFHPRRYPDSFDAVAGGVEDLFDEVGGRDNVRYYTTAADDRDS